jgi:hypothetical protein
MIVGSYEGSHDFPKCLPPMIRDWSLFAFVAHAAITQVRRLKLS